jgi:hypothetical protein
MQRVTQGLAGLEAELQRDLALLNYPPAPWVPERTAPDGSACLDVLVVGGGMCGVSAAFALRRLGIARIRVIDRAEAGLEGPWLTSARMERLRSPKHLTGPAQGLPKLTFRAWYEAQHGEAAWGSLGRIPRAMWAEYMSWYARVTGAGTESRHALLRLSPAEGCVAAEITGPSGKKGSVHARKIVLATGRDAQAQARIPGPLRPFAGTLVRHSGEEIDFEAVRGKRVAIIGVQASAFDNAGVALEAGAASVTILGRAPAMPRINKAKQIVYAGFVHGFPELPDAEKLGILGYIFETRIAPPRESVLRVSAHANARIELGCEVLAARRAGDGLMLETTRGAYPADLVVLGTGYGIDIAATPELERLAADIALWRDKVPAGAGLADFLSFPYLDAGFRFTERRPGAAPHLRDVHCFTHAAMVSLGNVANDIPAVSEGADRLARAIAIDLYRADYATHWRRLVDYVEPELLGDEAPAVTNWAPPVE